MEFLLKYEKRRQKSSLAQGDIKKHICLERTTYVSVVLLEIIELFTLREILKDNQEMIIEGKTTAILSDNNE